MEWIVENREEEHYEHSGFHPEAVGPYQEARRSSEKAARAEKTAPAAQASRSATEETSGETAAAAKAGRSAEGASQGGQGSRPRVTGIDGILCPVDFSERSLEALDTAFDLSEEFFANLYVMHVIKDFARDAAAVHEGVGFAIDAFREQLHTDALERINAIIESRTPVRTGVIGIVAHGDPALAIIEEAEKRDADLIVISSRGSSILKRLLIGSVTSRLLELSVKPVLILPPAE